jgi:signal peptidase II
MSERIMNETIHGSQAPEGSRGSQGSEPDSHGSHGSEVDAQGSHVLHGSEAEAPHAPEAPVRAPLVRPFELFLIGGVVIFDQLTKLTVRLTLPLHESRHIIPNLLDFTHVQNTGAAFGLLNAADFPYKSAVMIVVAALALVAISLYARQLGSHEQLSRYGLALILGGAFGNLIDRALSGYVVDFVDVYWGDAHFWAFNVADAAITVGAILVLLEMLGLGRRHASHST